MSGHSKWSQIKRTKEVVDQKRSQLFGKLSKDIMGATKYGTDPATNSALREAIARARNANMPQANIDRLLDRHSHTPQAHAVYEGFGPGGSAFLITASTDNPNRTVSELRAIFKKHGGELAPQGSVRWKFDDGYVPKYPLQVPNEYQAQLEELRCQLAAHGDVVQCITDTVQ